MGFRRVVTAERDGRSVVIGDETVERIEGAGIDPKWRSDSSLALPNDGTISNVVGFPEAGGIWVIGWVLHAGTVGEADNGIVSMDGGDAPGFHRTDSVDVHTLLEGSLVLELDDGTEVNLEPGDTVVVNGNRHRWHNRGNRTARALVTICGARRIP
jgi:mannose-6-phosphate isomerase-like protein (cupin superfamily)